jgi:hypothetical protein
VEGDAQSMESTLEYLTAELMNESEKYREEVARIPNRCQN